MNLLGWRKSLSISEKDPTFKVRYLGNVQTSVMKGDGCTDRATSIIWSNYMRSEHAGLDMKVVITGSGMKAYTKEQGLTEYRAHRISYCVAHPNYPKLFVWVYRHEGRKMKMELRCHAVLCKNEAKSKAMALQLHEKLSFALKEFQREKLRKQTSRVIFQRLKSSSKSGSILPLRTQLLSTANNFRPPVSKSQTAPKLGAITEDDEEDQFVEDPDSDDSIGMINALKRGSVGGRLEGNSHISLPNNPLSSGQSTRNGLKHHDIFEALDLEAADSFDADYFTTEQIIDLQIGNDLDELRRDRDVQFCLNQTADSDEESAESGFHEQDLDTPENDKGTIKRKGSSSSIEKDESMSVCHLPSYDIENILVSAITEKTTL